MGCLDAGTGGVRDKHTKRHSHTEMGDTGKGAMPTWRTFKRFAETQLGRKRERMEILRWHLHLDLACPVTKSRKDGLEARTKEYPH